MALAAGIWGWVRRGSSFAVKFLGATCPVRIGLPLSPKRIEKLQIQLGAGGVSLLIDPPMLWFRRSSKEGPAKALTSPHREA